MTHIEWTIALLKYLTVSSCLGIGTLTGHYPTPGELLTGLLVLLTVALFVVAVREFLNLTDEHADY